MTEKPLIEQAVQLIKEDNFEELSHIIPDRVSPNANILKWTALHWAAQEENPEFVELLLNFNANPNSKDFEGATPLHIAADGKCKKSVELLLKAGADPSIRNNFSVKASEMIENRGYGDLLQKSVYVPI